MISNNRGIKVLKGEGKKKLPDREKLVAIIILLVLSLLFLQVGYQWVNSWLYFRRVQVAVADTGSIDLTKHVKGIITRHEEVVNSSHTGIILGKLPEGDRVPVDGEVLTLFPDYGETETTVGDEEDISVFVFYYNIIRDWFRNIFFLEGDFDEDNIEEVNIHLSQKGESISVKSPQAGIVSYEIDGLEDTYLPEYPYNLLLEGREPDPIDGQGDEKSYFIAEGEPIFKIVDNWEWFFSIVVDSETGKKLENHKNINLTLSFFPNEVVNAYMVDNQMEIDEDLMFITYRIRRQVPGFTRYRWVEADINYMSHEGIKVPRSAIIHLDGDSGVYLNENGRVVFHPLEIIHKDDSMAIVDGINPNSIVIIRPDLVNEGQRLE